MKEVTSLKCGFFLFCQNTSNKSNNIHFLYILKKKKKNILNLLSEKLKGDRHYESKET